MATTKKTAPKKAQQAKRVDYTAMSEHDLSKLLLEKQNDLLTAKRSHRGGELVNPRVLGATRKDIARILTVQKAAKTPAQKGSK